MKRDIKNESLSRELKLESGTINEESRTISAALSSEQPVERWFGNEVLDHSAEAIDLSRAADGLPMLFGHDNSQPIGIIENLRLDSDKKLRGDLRFSPNNQRANEVWADVRDGFLKNVSIGYRINEWVENETDNTVRATRWQIYEGSIVPVPADSTVGVNRSKDHNVGVPAMDKTEDKTVETGGKDDSKIVVDFENARKAALAEGISEGRKLELERQDGIREAFQPYAGSARFEELRETCIRNGMSISSAKDALLRYLAEGNQPLAGDRKDERAPTVSVGEEAGEKFQRGVELALSVNLGLEQDREKVREARNGEFVSMNPADMAREYLRVNGQPVTGSKDAIIKRAMEYRAGGMTSSDFSNILENVANKALLTGYNETEETWSRWTRQGSLSDFRQSSRTAISAFGDLDMIKEDGEYTFGNVSDLKENIQLATYGKMLRISREALANDDLDALGRLPMAMGRAARRKIGDIVYSVLTTNAALNQDSTDLFHADHSNYVASGSGAAPSVATLDAARVAMATQTDPSGNATLGIMGQYLIVPVALQTAAEQLISATYDPTTSGDLKPNPFQNVFEVIADHRLDASLSTGWYLAANPNTTDTVEVAFLNGMQEPYMESQNGFYRDGLEYKVRIDAVAAALDYRGLYWNYGA